MLDLVGRPGGARLVDDPLAWEPDYGRPAEAQALWEARHGRALPHPAGAMTSLLKQWYGRTFRFPLNDEKFETLKLELEVAPAAGWILTRAVDGVTTRIRCGYHEWKPGRGPFGNLHDEPIAGSGAWMTGNTFGLKLCGTETPFYQTWKLRFEDDQLICEREMNVGFAGTKATVLTGRAE